MMTSPVIVRLRTQPELGEGILVSCETVFDPMKDENDQIIRGADGNPIIVKKREGLVCWVNDKSHFFPCNINDLEWVEVVAIRTLDEMKEEVIDEVLATLEESDSDLNEGEPEDVNDGEPSENE